MSKANMDMFVNNMHNTPAYAGMTKRGIRQMLDLFIGDIVKHIKDGDEILINGLGKLTTTVVHKPAHTGRNPKTGEAIKVPAKNFIRTRLLLEKPLRTEMAK